MIFSKSFASILLFTFTLIMHTKIKAQNKYTIEVNLNASSSQVWDTITDFTSYQKWNTVLIMKNNEDLEVGKKFNVTIINENGKSSKFKALTMNKIPYKEFSARQKILGKWFFSATHYFKVIALTDSQCTFIQTWEFTGLLFKPMRKTIFNQLKRFDQMNRDLKVHLEG